MPDWTHVHGPALGLFQFVGEDLQHDNIGCITSNNNFSERIVALEHIYLHAVPECQNIEQIGAHPSDKQAAYTWATGPGNSCSMKEVHSITCLASHITKLPDCMTHCPSA